MFHSSKETSLTCKGILTTCLSKSNNAILIQRRTHWLVMKCEKFQIAWSETKVNIIMDHKPQEIIHSLTFELPACNKRWSFSLQCTDLKWSIDLDQRKMNILKNWGCFQVIMSRTEGMWLWDRESTFYKRLWQKLGLLRTMMKIWRGMSFSWSLRKCIKRMSGTIEKNHTSEEKMGSLQLWTGKGTKENHTIWIIIKLWKFYLFL